jgi:hypothetical protein
MVEPHSPQYPYTTTKGTFCVRGACCHKGILLELAKIRVLLFPP